MLFLFVAWLIATVPVLVSSQGLSPPGVLGVSPAEAEKCDGTLAADFVRLVKAADKLSASPVQSGVLAAATTEQIGSGGCVLVADDIDEQLHVALAPAVYRTDQTGLTPSNTQLLPDIRDQGSCNTCVGQAVAAAAQAAVASQLLQPAQQRKLRYNARSLYYCGSTPRACAIGWDNLDAVSRVSSAPLVLDPCENVPDIIRQQDVVKACDKSVRRCASSTRMVIPACRYVELQTYASMQRHIRMHGGVVTRVNLYNPVFESFFEGEPNGTFNEAVLGATKNTSKPLGHSVLLVGYSNLPGNLEWTALNSWGVSFGDAGLFKVQMGLAGVGAGTDTYGLVCSTTKRNPINKRIQTSKRLVVRPSSEPGRFLHTIDVQRTPSLSYLADVLRVDRISEMVNSNINALPMKEVQRLENLTDSEVQLMTCLEGRPRTFGCILDILPGKSCRVDCMVTRLLLDPSVSLHGVQLSIKVPQTSRVLDPANTVLSTFGEVAALECPPGQQASGPFLDYCGVCPANTYQSNTSTSPCSLCPTGRVTTDDTAAGHDELADCVCSSGRSEVNGECVVCGDGEYKAQPGNEACLRCPAGSSALGQTARYHDELSDCKCMTGMYMTAAGTCEVCADGSFSNRPGARQCQPCPAGFVTSGSTAEDHNSLADCLCPPGTQPGNTTGASSSDSSQDVTVSGRQVVCSVCPPNTYSDAASLAPCRPCPAGTVTIGSSTADHASASACTCIPGQHKVDGVCTTCPANYFKPGSGDSGCTACPAGTATFNTTNAADHDSPDDCKVVWKQISLGGSHGCGTRAFDDAIQCWGTTEITLPDNMRSMLVDNKWKEVSVGGLFACGILSNDTVRCFGAAAEAIAPDPSWHISKISCGGYHCCFLIRGNDTLHCGVDPDFDRFTVPVDSSISFTDISSGGATVCGRTVSGSIACFGNDNFQQLQIPAEALEKHVGQVVSGAYWNGFITSDTGEAVYWGKDFEIPVALARYRWLDISSFFLHHCGLTTDREGVCWDVNRDASPGVLAVPERVGHWESINAGGDFSCGVTQDEHIALCWGSCQYSQCHAP